MLWSNCWWKRIKLSNLSKAIKFGKICYLKLFESFFSFEFICSWDWHNILILRNKGNFRFISYEPSTKHVKTIQEGFFNLPSSVQAFLRVLWSYIFSFMHKVQTLCFLLLVVFTTGENNNFRKKAKCSYLKEENFPELLIST